MKKFLFFFFLLFIGGIAGFIAWFSHSFNSDSYKAQIIKNLSHLTGRTVEIQGDVSLTWTPFPTLLISDLTLANQENSSNPIMFSVSQVKAEIDWSSLFKTPLVIRRVVLDRPVLLLERIKRYETNFNFPILFKNEQTIEDKTFLQGNSDLSLSINEVVVNQGAFTYINAIANEKVSLDGIDGTGIIASLNGPFSFSGTFLMEDKPKTVDLHIGKIEVSQPLSITTLNLLDKLSDTEIKSEGKIFQDTTKPEDWLTLSGVITSKKSDAFFQGIGINNFPSGKIVGSFTLKVMTDRTFLESLTARQGKGETETSFFFGMQAVDKEENATQVPTLIVKNMDFTKWENFLLSSLKETFWEKLSGDFRSQIENLKIRGELLEQIVAQGHIGDGVISISDLTAQLPQNSSLSFHGQWAPKEKNVKGEMHLQSADLRNFASWAFNISLPSLPEESFKNLQLISQIVYQPETLQIDVKTGVLDEVAFSGKLDFSLKEKIGLKADLDVKNLNLDTYFELSKENIKKSTDILNTLNLNLKAEDLKIKEHSFQQADIEAELKEKNLALKKFSAKTADNTSFDMNATFENLGTEKANIQNLKTHFSIPNWENFKTLTGIHLGEFFATKEVPVQGDISYTGLFEKGNIQANFLSGATELKIKSVVDSPFKMPQFSDAEISLVQSDVQKLKPISHLFPNLNGVLKISLNGSGDFKKFSASKALFELDEQILTGKMAWDLDQKLLQAELNSPLLNLDLFFPALDAIDILDDTPIEVNIPVDWQADLQFKADKMHYDGGKYTVTSAKMNLKDQILTVSDLTVFSEDKQGKLNGSGRIVFKAPMLIEGKFDTDKWNIQHFFETENLLIGNGYLTSDGTFTTSGNSRLAFVKALRGQGKFDWQGLQINGINVPELSTIIERALKQKTMPPSDTQMKHALSGGATIFTSLSGTYSLEQGNFNASEIKGITPQGEVLFDKINYSYLEAQMDALLSLVLNVTKNLPSLDIQLNNNILTLLSEGFNKALEQEITALKKQQQEEEERKIEQEAQTRQNEIETKAKTILDFSEQQITQLKNVLALHPSQKAQELMADTEGTLEDVRALILHSDLTAEQLIFLNEKVDLLNIKSREISQFLKQQDVLRQREAVQKLPPLVKTRLEEMIRIYNQNPESAVLAGLVQGSQAEENKITQNLELLSNVADLEKTQSLISEIKESFQKIQKALNYARQFDLEGEGI